MPDQDQIIHPPEETIVPAANAAEIEEFKKKLDAATADLKAASTAPVPSEPEIVETPEPDAPGVNEDKNEPSVGDAAVEIDTVEKSHTAAPLRHHATSVAHELPITP